MDQLFEFLKEMGVAGYNAKRLVQQATGFEDVALARTQELMDVPPDAGDSKYTQLKKAFSEAFRGVLQERKVKEQDKRHTEVVQEYERGRAKGIIPTRKQLEDMIAELYNSDEIMECVPRNVLQELREDPEALKAKMLEWGMTGTTMVHEMVGVSEPVEDGAGKEEADSDFDIPF